MSDAVILPEQLSTESAGIEVDNVSYHYPHCRHASLDNISLKLGIGQCIGLIGPNGAGKSTLLSVLSGLIKADQGEVRFHNRGDIPVEKYIRRNVALVPQEYAFYQQLTVLQNLKYFASLCSKKRRVRNERVNSALLQCQLLDEKDQQAKLLSGGYKRRLNLAIALLKEPSILYLDEPTVGVDPISREAILALICELKQQGKTLILTSHLLSEVQATCDDIVMLQHGKAIQFNRKNENKLLEIEFENAVPKVVQSTLIRSTGCNFSSEFVLQYATKSANNIFDVLAFAQQCQVPISSIHFGPESLTLQYMAILESDDPAKH